MERNQDSSWLKNPLILALCGGCIFAGFLLGMLIFGSPWHLPPAWGDIPTWITGIATVGLLAGAIVTAIYAIRAFRAQAREISDQAEMLNGPVRPARRTAKGQREADRGPRPSGR